MVSMKTTDEVSSWPSKFQTSELFFISDGATFFVCLFVCFICLFGGGQGEKESVCNIASNLKRKHF